jgi:hypothetical protein
MKKTVQMLSGLVFVLAISIIFNACLKDTIKSRYAYTFYVPVYKTKAEVKAGIKSNPPRSIISPGKIYVYGHFIFINDIDRGIHVIDNSNPYTPRNVSFINIPGNMDIAVKENTLYADLYTDLISIAIKNPENIVLKKLTENVFPYRNFYNSFSQDSAKIIVDWIRHDTVITSRTDLDKTIYGSVYMCYSSANASGSTVSVSPYGAGGSTSRFAIVNDRLYTAGATDLTVFDLAGTNGQVITSKQNIGGSIETIYPFKDQLFIGSQLGMYVYNVSDPDHPVLKGQFSHLRSCDPVVADAQYAYVTLRSGNICSGALNELDVLHLNGNDYLNPQLINIYQLKNPYGLSKDGNLLFVCDGNEGLKIFDVKDPMNIRLVNTVSNIPARDVIAFNGIAIVAAENGLYQYFYTSEGSAKQISKIVIGQ